MKLKERIFGRPCKEYYVKAMLKTFHLNGHTTGFQLQTKTFERNLTIFHHLLRERVKG